MCTCTLELVYMLTINTMHGHSRIIKVLKGDNVFIKLSRHWCGSNGLKECEYVLCASGEVSCWRADKRIVLENACEWRQPHAAAYVACV